MANPELIQMLILGIMFSFMVIMVLYQKAKKTFTISFTDAAYFIYAFARITSLDPVELAERIIMGQGGKIDFRGLAFELVKNVAQNLKDDPIGLGVELAVIKIVQQKFKEYVGRKTLLKLGPVRFVP